MKARRSTSWTGSLNSRQVAMVHLRSEILGGPDMTGAVCATIDPDLYFPNREDGITREVKIARKACIGCPVRLNCLLVAVEGPRIESGFWGGMTTVQARALQRQPIQGPELPPGWSVRGGHAVRPRAA